MNKYQKYRTSKKKDFESIAALQTHLFKELDSLKETSPAENEPDSSFNEFGEHEPLRSHNYSHNNNLLTKAKFVVTSPLCRHTVIKVKLKR